MVLPLLDVVFPLLEDSRALAYMRYTDEKAEDAPIYQHPNNILRRGRGPLGLELVAGKWDGADWVINLLAVIQVAAKKNKDQQIELYKIKRKDTDAETFQASCMCALKARRRPSGSSKGAWHLQRR